MTLLLRQRVIVPDALSRVNIRDGQHMILSTLYASYRAAQNLCALHLLAAGYRAADANIFSPVRLVPRQGNTEFAGSYGK